jgi:hypothetical protein
MMNSSVAPAGSGPEAMDYSKLVDLGSKIDKSRCYARNESSKYPMTNLFLGDSRLGCMSDTDDQLILHIEFQETVKVIQSWTHKRHHHLHLLFRYIYIVFILKIHSIKIDEYNRGVNPDLNPTKIRLFVNRTNMGFEGMDHS